jgi:autotransporter-associated beta strand protein
MKKTPRNFRVLTIAALALFGVAGAAFGQMQWSSYDTSGNLVTANVATGGDLASGTSVTFTIPANTQLFFVTKNFTPFSLAGASARKPVTFKASASAGLTGVAQRTMGWGLYSSTGTASLTDDVGYYGLWNGAGPYVETYIHPAGSGNLFSGSNPGEGKAQSGTPSDGLVYTNQIQLVMNSAQTGISLGTSSSTLAACGIAINGPSLFARGYTNPYTPLLGGATTFDEFAFMFNNTTANPVTVTLSAVGLGNTLTWDASGANPASPTDGSGNWNTATNANWSSGVSGAIGASDATWSSGYSAVIGANNGAAGTITITAPAGVTVSNITFNAAGSGNYTVSGYNTNSVSTNNYPLILTGSPTITVASGVTATNTAFLGGTGFTKAGNGTLVFLPTVAATNAGTTVVNAGVLTLASTGVNSLNDSVTVNPGAVLQIGSSVGINPAGTLTINGGAVTNLGLNGTSTETHNLVVFDNNGILAYGPTGSGQIVATNFDFRSGLECFPKFAAAQFTNFSVKSTPGTMAVQSRPNNSGIQGMNLTVLAGTMILDYPNPAPNGDTTQGGQKLMSSVPLTLGGGILYGRFNAAASRTETVLSTIILPGATSVWMTNNAGNGTGGYTIVQNALNRSVGGTVDYSIGGTSTGVKTISTTSANVNGILGGWATYNGTDWAVGTTIAPLAAASYQASTDPTTWGAASNVTLNASTISSVNDGTSINSLRLTAASTVTLGGTLTLTSGGLLVTGSGATTITGGTLEGASGADLIINQYAGADLTISSTLADNTSASALTKSGPGNVNITGVNNMTGNNYLNGGTVSVSGLTELAGGSLVMNNGTLRYTGSDATSSRSVLLAGTGGTFDIQGSATVTQTTPIVSGGGASHFINGGNINLGDWGGLTKLGSGTLVLAANNVYNGPTVVSNGVLFVNGTNALTGTSGLTNYSGGGSFIVYGGTLGGTGMISGSVDIKNGGTISPGNSIGTLNLASGFTAESGSTSLFSEQNGSSGSSLQVQGNLIIQSNATIAINILGSALNATTNTLITYTGTKTGSFNPTVVVAGGSLNSSMSIDDSTPGLIKLVTIPQVVITSQPQSIIASTNDTVIFTVGATGANPLGYQWYYTPNISTPAVPIPLANSSSYVIVSADGTNDGLYSVVVTNNYNSVTSSIASLTVGNQLPQLYGPFDQTVIQGNNATFSAIVVSGNPYPTFQWQTNGVSIVGATSTNLTLNNVQYSSLNGVSVCIIASNAAGSVTNCATLNITVPPGINPQPTNITVNVGDTATFVSGFSGGIPAPALQWYKNGTILSGQTGSTLTIANAQGSNIGLYSLVVTNVAGSVTSSVVKLTVNSTTLAPTAVGPVNGATGICYDTPLYLTLNGPISIVNSGRIRIYNSTNLVTPVDVIDMSSNTVFVATLNTGIFLTNNFQPHSLFSGDSQVINYFPVIITGNTAAIYPHSGVMTSNQTYIVTMDNGIVADSTGAYFAGISDTNAWRFSTKPTGPANPTNLVVAADGSGDFLTVQGAVDSIPAGNNAYSLVNIRNGNYVEIVNISGKNNVTFRGQSRYGTVVGYMNNNNINGTTAARMAFKVNSTNIAIENLTLTNATPQGGSQAETLLVYNNGVRCVVNYCDIKSRQDTILINANTSQAYFYYDEIYGNFDYIWGVGVGYFDHCSFHTITNQYSSSYNLTAARTATAGTLSTNFPWVNPNGTLYSAYGFSFVNCTIQADAGVTGITMAGSNGTAGGLDSWVNCLIDTNAYVSPSTALSNTYVFWQNNNLDITGTYPISFTNIQTIGVTNNDPRLLAATNIPVWFSGWVPQLAPNILTNPASQSIAGGQSATFTVVATGIPAPTYQWLENGTNLVGQTGSTLTISSAYASAAGTYSVIVANASGSVTSSSAILTVGNTAPTLAPVADQTTSVGLTLNVTNVATDPDVPPQYLTFALLTSPTGATIDPVTGIFTWRAPVASANTTNPVTVTVTDSGSPSLSATQSFNVIVNPVTQPTASAVSYVNGQFSLTVSGDTGPDYILQTSTDLINWQSVLTNSSPATPFTFTDTNAAAVPTQFYRVLLGP